MYTKVIKFAVLVFSLFCFETMFAHNMGLGISKLLYANDTLSFTTRLFYSDFYYEFIETASVKDKDYIKMGFDKKDLLDLKKYFSNNIQIWCDDKPHKFQIFTYKIEPHDDVYVFVVEVKVKVKIQEGSKIKIRDTALFKTIENQRQLINVFLKGIEVPSHGIITLDMKHPEYEFIN